MRSSVLGVFHPCSNGLIGRCTLKMPIDNTIRGKIKGVVEMLDKDYLLMERREYLLAHRCEAPMLSSMLIRRALCLASFVFF